MALLTNAQATTLYNGSKQRFKITIDGVFNRYRVIGTLDGFEYNADSLRDSLALTDISTASEIEDAFIAYFETINYYGTTPLASQTNF